MSTSINCPKCGETFELTDAIAGGMFQHEREKLRAEAKALAESERVSIEAMATAAVEAKLANRLRAAEAAVHDRDIELAAARAIELDARKAKEAADTARRDIELDVRRQVDAQRAEIEERVTSHARKETESRLKAFEAKILEKDAKLKVAEEAELDARRLKAEAEEAKRQAELMVIRRLDEERAKVREQTPRERDDEHRLKITEKEKQLADLKEKLDEVQRKADVGSQQLKGDVLELDLHDALTNAFPGDEFERIKKGQSGGDVIHTVRSLSGLICGRIKWESKHTQNWSDAWLPKLRDDQREHKCDVAALMTQTLPNGVIHFDEIDSVWVSSISTVIPMAAALRRGLIETASARRAAAGAEANKDIVYGYVTGPEFRARVRGVVEPIVVMRVTLDSEKRSAARQFAIRDKQLDRMALSLSGMYGDLQGLVGPSLPTVEGLALPKPEEGDAEGLPVLESGGEAATQDEVH